MKTLSNDSIGGRIRNTRSQLGLSIQALAEAIGVHRNTLTNYELGKKDPELRLLQYFAARGIDVHWLVTGEGADHLVSPPQTEPSQTVRIEIAVVSRDPVTFNFVPGVNRDEQDESPKD